MMKGLWLFIFAFSLSVASKTVTNDTIIIHTTPGTKTVEMSCVLDDEFSLVWKRDGKVLRFNSDFHYFTIGKEVNKTHEFRLIIYRYDSTKHDGKYICNGKKYLIVKYDSLINETEIAISDNWRKKIFELTVPGISIITSVIIIAIICIIIAHVHENAKYNYAVCRYFLRR